MAYSTPSRKTRILLLILAVVIIFSGLKAWQNKKSSNTSTNQGNTIVTQPELIGLEDFVYQKPAGWAQLAKQVLDENGAINGVGRVTAPAATFMIRESASAPASDSELNDSVLAELKNLSNFELIESDKTDVGGKTGQKFVYRFGASNNRVKQDLRVIVHKQKTFFLLFSATAADFDKQTADFEKILSDFKFQ